MILIIQNRNNAVIEIYDELFDQEQNAQIRDNGDTYIRSALATYPKILFNFKLCSLSIPIDYKQEKYCYTESQGFYLNEDWVDPDEISDDDAVEIITGEEVISDTDALNIITGEQQITSGQVLTIIEGGDL